MEGPDCQMALLLQRQFEQESSYDTDFHLALKLQNDFDKELSTENSVSLVYDNKKKSEGDSRSLVDPSWELIDPTPNIYNLFVVFNQRFFWNKLLTVCVSWSKRMTSCAGICSYQGQGGMCSITLSEPLLKLRPRKDLVETLLHEMIHAYLFVTHNNRDRDGHGPEFHKHMYRINNEAGTNITVYHSFRDEVRLYQQHWWRCNGACQNRKPYFGMVRRATNRAPGPNDRWWDEHFRSCGGTFIKVKEPEKKTKTKKGDKQISNETSTSDIRNFLPIQEKSNHVNSNSSVSDKGGQNGNTSMHGFSNVNKSTQNSLKVSQASVMGNIHGFTNLNTTPQNSTSSKGTTNNKFNNIGSAVKTKSNSNSTIVINKKSNLSNGDKVNEIKNSRIDIFSGTGNYLTSSEKADIKNNADDYSVVRNHWLNKFSSSSSVNKRNSIDSPLNENLKKLKTQEETNIKNDVINIVNLDDSFNFVSCPVCEKQIKDSLLNDHLDLCLQNQHEKNNDTKHLCFICNKKVAQIDYRNHVYSCFDDNMGDDIEELVECEICNVHFNKKRIEAHRKSCIENIFAGSSQDSTTQDSDTPEILKSFNDILSQCPVCDDFVESKELNNHKEECLLKVFDNLDKKYDLNKNEEVSCLVCNKKVLKSELNSHLDDCMGNVFHDKNDFCTPSKENKTQNHDDHVCDDKNNLENKYNCPFCMELYSELDMSGHLDQCLATNEGNNDKTILIDSFSNDIL